MSGGFRGRASQAGTSSAGPSDKGKASWSLPGFEAPWTVGPAARELAREIGDVPRLKNLRKDGQYLPLSGWGMIDRLADEDVLDEMEAGDVPFSTALSNIGHSGSIVSLVFLFVFRLKIEIY